MCGVFGFVGRSASVTPDEGKLRASTDLLAHRGPDDSGIYVGQGVGLGHTRLALLDLSSRAGQPMWDESGRYGLVYNGEIYNHAQLRRELEVEGRSFRTDSDTEVVLHALTTWGVDDSLLKFEGMFAFALYDSHRGSVVLARDRFGIKPLYLYADGEQVIFSSEIRAFRPWITPKVDLLSVSSFLHGFGGPTNGHTFYEGVRFLGPGCVAELAVGEAPRYRQVLDMDDLWKEEQAAELAHRKPEQLADEVEEALTAAVESQLIADAPVGALCSGGVDSSLILAIAARRHPDLAIFHANVVGRHSERAAAESLASHLGLRLRVVDVSDRHTVELMPEVIDHSGHPFVKTPHSIPFLLVSELVRKNGVKAVLSGEGADECFLGYAWQAPGITVGAQLRRRIARRLGDGTRTPVHLTRFPREAEHLVTDLHNRFEATLDSGTGRLQPGVDAKRNGGIQTLDALGYNLRALLHRNDAMGMARSIEARFPYLDQRLVGLALHLPYRTKRRWDPISGRPLEITDKWVLRRVADRYLPRHLSRREKLPFTVDAAQRLKVDPRFFHRGMVSELFGLTDQAIDQVMQQAPQPLVLRLLHLEVWMHVCIALDAREEIRSRLLDHTSFSPVPTRVAG